jgi:hypothetical protein
MMSLNMLIEFGEAFDFTGAQFTEWCKEAGFSRCEIIPLVGPASAAQLGPFSCGLPHQEVDQCLKHPTHIV